MTLSNKRYGKVLVLGRDNRSFLSVIRSLGRHGIEVHGAFCAPDIAAIKSKYLHTYHRDIKFSPDSLEWKDKLLAVLKKERFDLVIPCEDTSGYYLTLYKDEFLPYTQIYLLNDNAYNVTRDKGKTYELAQSLNISVPRQMMLRKNDPGLSKKIANNFKFPIVLKPPVSFNKNLQSRNFVHKAYSIEETEQILQTMPDIETLIIQENFIGIGVGIELLMHNGQTLVAFQHQRVHEPLMGGGSSYRKSVKLDSDLLDASEKFLKSLDYTGVAMVEFKVNPKTGRWVLLEINGRFWGSLPLPVSLGVDFPFYLYELLVNGKKNFPQDYRTGVYCRNLPRDWIWMRQNYHADKTDATLATQPVWKAVLTFFNILLFRERNDTLVLDDLKPGIDEWSLLFANIRREYIGKIREHFAKPSRFARYRARKEFKKAQCVLFVCKGNICRSPFAATVASLLTNKDICSAGYYPYNGRQSPENAIEAAKQFEIDLSAHRSQIINKRLVRNADCILVFDKYNMETLYDSFPDSRKKIHLLGCLSPNLQDIADPFNKDVDTFKTTYDQIFSTLEQYKQSS